MSQTVWIARHGNRLDFVNPAWFETAARPYDPPLSADGWVQVGELAARLQSEKIRYIFASPFLRTVQTAYGVAEVLDVPVRLHWGLCEWLNEDWMKAMPETGSLSELAAEFPRIDATVPIRGMPRYPETEQECLARAGAAIAELVQELPEEDFLCVGHGASVLGMTMGLVEGVKPREVNTSLCCLVKVVRKEQGWVMELNGDTSHLSRRERVIRLN